MKLPGKTSLLVDFLTTYKITSESCRMTIFPGMHWSFSVCRIKALKKFFFLINSHIRFFSCMIFPFCFFFNHRVTFFKYCLLSKILMSLSYMASDIRGYQKILERCTCWPEFKQLTFRVYHAHVHMRARARAHTHTHTHTQSEMSRLISMQFEE